ncbi:GGDEF domain-containing protein [Aquabacterium sp. J223]|uniref:GGDEF domain-containing protein n=1 Tax=Aquabacterium sp. J223 TaxID=2898431 RepID=UPI0021AE0F40|nr:GGDEF domain-containing protein [Aquabacterium sp. J223]UUX94958.1 GGDEF domain-containing protein [Aquabacterium sp. J223]
MSDVEPLQLLQVTPPGAPLLAAAGWQATRCDDLAQATQALAARRFDALLAPLPAAPWPGLGAAALDTAVVLLAPGRQQLDAALPLLLQGVQDLLPDDADDAERLRSLRLAVERKRVEREARKAWTTDLATGLPSQAQLAEHMSQLLALRQREPAPMALLVLRLEGFATTEQRLGRESAQVLRRKAAVRLRAGVRASDVVAALGPDAFGVLLSALEEPAHARRVADKLLAALHRPFSLAGHPVAVAAVAGVALCPGDGDQPDALLRHAAAQAALQAATHRGGLANRVEQGGALPRAANDDEPPSDG